MVKSLDSLYGCQRGHLGFTIHNQDIQLRQELARQRLIKSDSGRLRRSQERRSSTLTHVCWLLAIWQKVEGVSRRSVNTIRGSKSAKQEDALVREAIESHLDLSQFNYELQQEAVERAALVGLRERAVAFVRGELEDTGQ